MKILSFDVSGDYSSIALLNSDEVNSFTQTHERKNRPNWDELFSKVGFDSKKDFNGLNAIAFARGPGSYTALRITASFLKAIAVVKKLPLIPISNLKAIAHEASNWINESEVIILVTIKADQNECYFGSFKKTSKGIEITEEESIMSMEVIYKMAKKKNVYFAGNGWPESINSNPKYLSNVLGGAEAIAILAKHELEVGEEFDPANANPVYLKTLEYQKK